MKSVDLHVHSNKSDGTLAPSDLVTLALSKGLAASALTDNDTTEGIDEALAAASAARADGAELEVIPGIEFSTEYEGKDIHIVGVDITYEKLRAEYPDSVLTRAHYAKYMLEHGAVKSMSEAFDRYIGDRAPCFLPREKVTPSQAVSLILESGGIPILAHPILYHMSDARLDKLVATLKEVGLVGIEAIYSTYNSAEERQIRKLAAKYDLCISGGSDFHGGTKPGLEMGNGYGKLFVPYEVLEKLRER